MHLRSNRGKFLTRAAVALALASLFVGCAIDNNGGGSFSVKPAIPGFSRPPRWSVYQFDPRSVNALAIVVPYTRNTGMEAINESAAMGIDSEFTKSCLDRGYPLVARANVDEVIREIQRQNSGLSDPSTAIKAGKQLNASHVLVIQANVHMQQMRGRTLEGKGYTYFQSNARLDAQIIEVQSGRQVGAASDSSQNSADGPNDTVPIVARMAKRLAASFPVREGMIK